MVDVESGVPEMPAAPTPGWKTSEFWLNLAALVVTFVISSGAFPGESWQAKVLGVIAAVLISMGYTGARGGVKARALTATTEYNKAAVAYQTAKLTKEG